MQNDSMDEELNDLDRLEGIQKLFGHPLPTGPSLYVHPHLAHFPDFDLLRYEVPPLPLQPYNQNPFASNYLIEGDYTPVVPPQNPIVYLAQEHVRRRPAEPTKPKVELSIEGISVLKTLSSQHQQMAVSDKNSSLASLTRFSSNDLSLIPLDILRSSTSNSRKNSLEEPKRTVVKKLENEKAEKAPSKVQKSRVVEKDKPGYKHVTEPRNSSDPQLTDTSSDSKPRRQRRIRGKINFSTKDNKLEMEKTILEVVESLPPAVKLSLPSESPGPSVGTPPPVTSETPASMEVVAAENKERVIPITIIGPRTVNFALPSMYKQYMSKTPISTNMNIMGNVPAHTGGPTLVKSKSNPAEESDESMKKAKKKRKNVSSTKKEQRKAKKLPNLQGKVIVISQEMLAQFMADTKVSDKSGSETPTPRAGSAKGSFEKQGGSKASGKSGGEKPALTSGVKMMPSSQRTTISHQAATSKSRPVSPMALNRTAATGRSNSTGRDKYAPALLRIPGEILLNRKALGGDDSKLLAAQSEPSGSRKKPSPYLEVNLMEVLKNQLKKEQEKKKSRSSVQSKKSKSVSVTANILDSSGPIRMRGKERLTPKKKRPTAMKRAIMEEKLQKKTGNSILTSADCLGGNSTPNSRSTDSSSSAKKVELISSLSIARKQIHSRKFREYCNQMLSPGIDELITDVIRSLILFHDRLYAKNPTKAKMRRRMCKGFKEVSRHLTMKHLKLVIIPPDLDRIQLGGGIIDDTIRAIVDECDEQGVQVVFALNRRQLGRVCLQKVPVSCVGVFDYGGCEDKVKTIVELTAEAKEAYGTLLNSVQTAIISSSSSGRSTTEPAVTRRESLPDDNLTNSTPFTPEMGNSAPGTPSKQGPVDEATTDTFEESLNTLFKLKPEMMASNVDDPFLV